MTVETPQPRDRVRWKRTSVIEGVVEETGADGIVVRDADGYKHLCQVDDATIEVLERADDPSDLPVGTIKRLRLGAVYAKREARDGEDPWVYLYGGSGDGQRRTVGDDVADSGEVIGAVAGSPAAEAQKPMSVKLTLPSMSVRVPNEPHGLPLDVRAKIANHLRDGDLRTAVVVAQNAGLPDMDALSYIRGMSEYQAYLSKRGHRTEVDPTEADRMRAMGFNKQPEVKISEEDRLRIEGVLVERMGEYLRAEGQGDQVDTSQLAGVVADIVYAAIVQDRKRGDR